jgi:hypothetical protein
MSQSAPSTQDFSIAHLEPEDPPPNITKPQQIKRTRRLLEEARKYVSELPENSQKSANKKLKTFEQGIEGTIGEEEDGEISETDLMNVLKSFDGRLIKKEYVGGRRKTRRQKQNRRKTRRYYK